MADKGADNFCERDEFDISQIIKLQAALRGASVRKWMKKVREAFEETFAEIERNPAIEISWKSDHITKPKLIKIKHGNRGGKETCKTNTSEKAYSRATQSKLAKPDNKQLKGNVTSELRVSGETSQSFSDQSDNVAHTPKYSSVEIQTSFIDMNSQPFKPKNVVSEEANDCGNILEELDTSWKDRVEPFLQNKFGDAEPEKDNKVVNELHLELDRDTESPRSDLSGRTSDHSSRHADTQYTEPTDISHKSQFIVKSTAENGQSSRSAKSQDSQTSLLKNDGNKVIENDHRDIVTEKCQRSRRTSSSRSNALDGNFKEGLKDGDLSDRQSSLSGRSGKSRHRERSGDRDQDNCETERFSPRSQRSNRSQRSESNGQRSSRSQKESKDHLIQRTEGKTPRSDGSQSHRSDRSDDRTSQRSQRSRQCESQMSDRSEKAAKMCPRPSSASPVAFHHSTKEESFRQGKVQDSTSLTNVTSVWDSFNSVRESHDIVMPSPLPQDTTQLKELRKNVSMELLWVLQAIDSRKNYLKLKGKM